MKKRIPFEFILDYLHPLEITIKPMFGCHAIYSGGKILLIVRKKDTHTDANGIWIATERKHHASLKKDIPFLISISILSESKENSGIEKINLRMRIKESGFKTKSAKSSILNRKSLISNQTNWQMIHEDESDFETAATKLCEMIIKGDERIGKISKRRPPLPRSAKALRGGKKGEKMKLTLLKMKLSPIRPAGRQGFRA